MVECEGVMAKPKHISFEDVSVLIFDVIGVKPEHCASVALSTARYDTKEVKLKPGVDPTQYTTKDTPLYFKDHQIEVRPQSACSTRVSFKNVPFNIPDEELINLCKCYGVLQFSFGSTQFFPLVLSILYSLFIVFPLLSI